MGTVITAKQVATMAITAALFTIFFYLSGMIAVPKFTFLYLPIVLLWILPLWFGWSGLVGSMIGGVMGGILVEGLGPFAWIEATTVFMIYSLNWLLLPKQASNSWRWIVPLIGVYALTLFLGTLAILWQLTAVVGAFPQEVAIAYIAPVFGLNFLIEAILCPIIVRSLSPKMQSWGFSTSTIKPLRAKTIKAKN